MPAIRPEPTDTSFETPAMADTGALDYYKNVAYDALYHSPVSGSYRMSSLYQEKNDTDLGKLTPDEANQQYGMDGELKFDEPITESAASLMQQRKAAEMRREYLLQAGSENHWGRSLSGFGVSMVSQLVDPVNLASMFLPVVGENRLLQGVKEAPGLFSKGLISPKTLAKLTTTNPLGYRLAKGALEGLVGMSLVRPFDIIPTLQEQGHYEWTDEFKNLAISAGLGAGLHATLGAISDHFNSLKKGLQSIDPGTHEAAVASAVSDLAKDEHVTSPAKIIDVDHNLVDHDIQGRFDEEDVQGQRSQEQMPSDLPKGSKSGDTITPEMNSGEKIELRNGYRLEISDDEGLKGPDVTNNLPDLNDAKLLTYRDSKGNYAGRLIIEKLKDGLWVVSDHELNDSAMGKGLGRQAVTKLADILGSIGSYGGASEDAIKMWKAIGAKKEGSGYLLEGKSKYQTAIKGSSGKIFTSDTIPAIEGKSNSQIPHSEMAHYLPEDERKGSSFGFVDKDGNFKSFLDVARDKMNPEAIKQETQSRIESTQSQESKPQPEKTAETPIPSDKELGTQPVEAPEQVKMKSDDEKERAELQALLQAEMADLEKSIGDLNADEFKIVKGSEDKDLGAKTKAVESGINCILKKAI